MKSARNQHQPFFHPLIRHISAGIFALVILCSSVLPVLAQGVFISQDDADTDPIYDPEKIFSTATIDQDFAPDSVVVVIKKAHSGINKVFETERFSTSKLRASDVFSKVEDLTYFERPVEEYKYLDPEKSKQILKLTLTKPGKQNVLDTIKELEKLDFIESAEPNHFATLCAVPNDSRYGTYQDYMQSIGLEEAWDITTGSSSVRVGVIDTGIATHRDLNWTDSNVQYNVVSGYDYWNYNDVTTDDIPSNHPQYLEEGPHGTAVASVIGAVTNNDQGMAGVCWNVSLVPMQVSRFYSEYDAYKIDACSVIRAIRDATLDIPILNCSFVFDYYDNDLISALSEYTGLAVCAAGNYGNNTDYVPAYPACYPLDNIISVGGLDTTLTEPGVWSDVKASSYGQTTVDLFAPSTRIQIVETTYVTAYGVNSGTSFAAPFVTGVAALIKSIRPNASATEIKAYILQNVDPITDFDKKCLTGGKLNAYKAVKAAQEGRFQTEPLMGDVNGDGIDDIIYHYPSNGKRAFTVYLGTQSNVFSGPNTTVTTHSYRYDDPAFVGDVNGDGKDDIVIHWTNASGKRVLLTLISNGNGTFPTTGVNFASGNNHNPSKWAGELFLTDVNGDGKADFVVQWKTSGDKRTTYTYLGKASSSGGYFSAAISSTSSVEYKLQDEVFTGDFNGDGRADLLVQTVQEDTNKRQLITYLGNSNGSFSTPATFTSNIEFYPFHVTGHWSVPSQFFVGDVNGDGYDDFVVNERVPTDGVRRHLVYRGKATGTYFNEAVETLTTNSYQIAYKTHAGDFNGDGKMDLMEHRRSSGKRLLVLYSGNASGGFNTSVSYLGTRTHNPAQYPYKVTVGSKGTQDCFIVHWSLILQNFDSLDMINYFISSDPTTMTAGVDTMTNSHFTGA